MMAPGTILNLDLKMLGSENGWRRMSLGELKTIHQLMATDLSGYDAFQDTPVLSMRFFIGQPVTLTRDFHVIRIALDAPLVVRWYQLEHVGSTQTAVILREDEQLVEKLDILLHNFKAFEAVLG